MQNKADKEAQKYFNSLPKYLQETIIQSGAEYSNKKELENITLYIKREQSPNF